MRLCNDVIQESQLVIRDHTEHLNINNDREGLTKQLCAANSEVTAEG